MYNEGSTPAMMIRKIALPRRHFLRSAGVMVGLPLLDAMVPALTATARTAANPVRRFGVVYVPNGMIMQSWTPEVEGPGFELTPILKPLEPFRDQLLVLTGLNGVVGMSGHAGRSTAFLTGVTQPDHGNLTNDEYELRAGVSADQLLARAWATETQLASLELAIESRDVSGSCDVGYACAYTNTISWRTENTPLPMEYNPRAVFERLFGDSGSTDQKARVSRIKRDRSILDSLTAKINDLNRELGPHDRQRVGEYLEAVRDVERRVQKAEEQSAKVVPVVEQPAGTPDTYDEHVKLMFDLQVLAYQSDLTRIITFMMAREISGRGYPEIGVPDSHHPTSHHRENPGLMAKCTKINSYHMQLFSEYVEKLRSTPDGDGSLLDHIALIYGAGMSNSDKHDPNNLPIALLGGGCGQLKGGRHLKYASGTPMSNLLVTLLGKLGLPIEKIGGSTGKLAIDTLPLA
jgi:hypothetical protein